jgi:hypothetical protein
MSRVGLVDLYRKNHWAWRYVVKDFNRQAVDVE